MKKIGSYTLIVTVIGAIVIAMTTPAKAIYSYISTETAPHPQKKVPEPSTLLGPIVTFCFFAIHSRLGKRVNALPCKV